jgi:hypothetical protein
MSEQTPNPAPSSAAPTGPPGDGRQSHPAMRLDAMLPLTGPGSTDALAAGGGLNVPGGEPQPVDALTTELSAAPAIPELIPGAYERDTAAPREPGAIGGRFNGADNTHVDPLRMLDERTADEHRKEGGGEEHD